MPNLISHISSCYHIFEQLGVSGLVAIAANTLSVRILQTGRINHTEN